MIMMIPFNPAVIYSFLLSRSCTKTPPQGKSSMILPIIWILSSSLFQQHFPYILLFHLFHSTSKFIVYYIVWAKAEVMSSSALKSHHAYTVPCPWWHTPFICRFELNSELCWSSILLYLMPHLLSTLTTALVENHWCSVRWISTGPSGLEWVRRCEKWRANLDMSLGDVHWTLALTV